MSDICLLWFVYTKLTLKIDIIYYAKQRINDIMIYTKEYQIMLITSIDHINTSQLKVPKSTIEKMAIFCLNTVINNAHYVGVRVSVTSLEAQQHAYQESANRLQKLYSAKAANQPFHFALLHCGNCWGNLNLLLEEFKKNKISESDIDCALKFIVQNIGKFAYAACYYLNSNLELKRAY